VASVSILEELWYGNIAPNERYLRNSAEYKKLLELLARNQDALLSRLNDEEKATFEKYADCMNEMACITEQDAFIKGFTLGAKIIIEVMTAENE
jgi:hypothetical protein